MPSANRLLLVVERDGDTASNASRQLMSLAREHANRLGVEFGALVLGHDLQRLAQTVSTIGPDVLYVADAPALADYSPALYVEALLQALKALEPRIIVLPDSFVARETGPAAAFRLGMPFLSNCVALELSESGLTAVQPRYGGAVHVKMQVPTPAMVCLQPGRDAARDAPVARPARVIPVPVNIEASNARVKVVGTKRGGGGDVDLARAEIIVSCGRGLGKPDNIALLRELAAALGGVIGCSRPLCDMGWLPVEHLVGMSGRTVTPRVYLACGISGAPQHIAGMKDARRIIAINKDASAPIFGVAHYGVVGDLFQVVPAMIQQARKGSAST